MKLILIVTARPTMPRKKEHLLSWPAQGQHPNECGQEASAVLYCFLHHLVHINHWNLGYQSHGAMGSSRVKLPGTERPKRHGTFMAHVRT